MKASIAVVALAVCSLAHAKGEPRPVAADTAKTGIAAAAPRASSDSPDAKPENRAGKATVAPPAAAEPAKDPYAVPLFQQAKPLLKR